MAAKQKCKYGKVQGGARKGKCRKRRPTRKAASKGKSRVSRKCKYGKLKNPVGKRVCKKRPRKGRKK